MVGTEISAKELFRAAYENRYTWDASFPGYSAEVTYRQGDTKLQGTVAVSADLKASVDGIEDEDIRKAIHSQLFEVSIHRVRRRFEDTHGQNTFVYGTPQKDGSVEILMGGKAEGDRYHIKDKEVSLVHRHIHGVVVTINTFSTHDTGEGYLAHRYDSIYEDPATGETKGGPSDFEDDYKRVGDYYILSRRYIATETEHGPSEAEFVFSKIQLASEA